MDSDCNFSIKDAKDIILPNGSAGGCDSLRPQHLKDLIFTSTNNANKVFLSALASVTSLVKGDTLHWPIMFWYYLDSFEEIRWWCEAQCSWMNRCKYSNMVDVLASHYLMLSYIMFRCRYCKRVWSMDKCCLHRLDLRLYENIIIVTVGGLRLGSSLCRPHTCHPGGRNTNSPALMDSTIKRVRVSTTNMLSCQWYRLISVEIPFWLELSGLGEWNHGPCCVTRWN